MTITIKRHADGGQTLIEYALLIAASALLLLASGIMPSLTEAIRASSTAQRTNINRIWDPCPPKPASCPTP